MALNHATELTQQIVKIQLDIQKALLSCKFDRFWEGLRSFKLVLCCWTYASYGFRCKDVWSPCFHVGGRCSVTCLCIECWSDEGDAFDPLHTTRMSLSPLLFAIATCPVLVMMHNSVDSGESVCLDLPPRKQLVSQTLANEFAEWVEVWNL